MHHHASAARSPSPHCIALAVSSLLIGSGAFAQTAAPAPAAAASAPKASAPATAAAPGGAQVIVVQGTRASIEGAISRKRNAATVTDSIVAEDVDQFPDKNVGEALSRITGVQLTREFGEGSQVSIRGIEPDLNRVEINGLSVLNTSGGGGRGAELRELAAELIQSIDVVKGVLPNITEGGVGGTVRINTRKPLDFKERTVAMTLSGEHSTLRGGTQPRATFLAADKFMDGKLGLMANIVYDQVYTRGDFARNTGWTFLRDWDNSPEKTRGSRDAEINAVTTKAGCATLVTAKRAECDSQWFDYAPNTPRLGVWTRDHERISGEFTLQYQVNRNLDFDVSYQINSQDQRLNDRNFGTSFGNNANNAASLRAAHNRLATAAGGRAPVYNAAGALVTAGTCGAVSTTATPAGMTFDNHTVTGYTVGDCMFAESNNNGQLGGFNAFSTSARDFKLKIESKYGRTGFRYRTPLWRVEGLAGTSSSSYVNETNNISLSMSAPGLKVALNEQRLPTFTFPTGFSPDDPNSYFRADVQYRPSVTRNSEDTAKLDFQRALTGLPLLNRLWFGAQGTGKRSYQFGGGQRVVDNGPTTATTDDVLTQASNYNGAVVWDRLAPVVPPSPATNLYANPISATTFVNRTTMQNLAREALQPTQGGFFNGYSGISGYGNSWLSPDFAAASKYFDLSRFNRNNLYTSPANNGQIYEQLPAFDIRENVAAGYVRLDFDTTLAGLPIEGNFGARYARTEVKATGTRNLRTAVWNPVTSAFVISGNATDIVTIERQYNDVLPSFNIATSALDNNLVVRAGWGKVMSRPNLSQIAPNVSCVIGQGSDTVNGGDGRDDCTAGNPNLRPYRATKTDLSIEYYPARGSQFSMGLFRNDIKSYVLPTRQLVPNVDFFGNGQTYDVTMWINGEGAITQGVELAARQALNFLPGWASGFGVDANMTLMNFKYAPGKELVNPLDGSELSYPGLSKRAYNLALWYDQGLVNARLAYHHRGRFYTGGNDVTGNPNYRQETGYLDAKLQLRLTKKVTLSFEGKNLTDQAELTYAGDLGRPNELAWSGRRYYVSLSYKL